MVISVNEGASVFYLLECLHIQGARKGVNADVIECITCGGPRKAIRVTNPAWRIECASCQPAFKRFVNAGRLKCISLSRRHLERYKDHEVKVFNGVGELQHTFKNFIPPFFEDPETGAPF